MLLQRNQELISNSISKGRPEMFLVQEVKTNISCLEEILRVDISNLHDDQIKSRKEDMSKHLKQMKNLSKKDAEFT